MEIIFLVLGLTLGSFYNVVGLRIPKKSFFQSKRSYCPHCKVNLAWYELIPVFSFLYLKGKCNYCNKGISFIYPITELFTGIMFAYSYSYFGLQVELVVALMLVSLSAVVFVTDIKYMLIPNRVLLSFLPLFILVQFFLPLENWWSPILGCLTGLVLLFFIIVISKGGMGGGDMKLFGVLGLVLGVKKILLAFLLSTIFGAVIVGLLFVLNLAKRKNPFPFGPFIVIGSLVSYFFGDAIIYWYIGSFF